MRIVEIIPGTGGSFYCENCIRDLSLVRELRRLGHDPILVPLYLPLRGPFSSGAPETKVFFGGVNVYLQQKSALFRKTPRWVDRLFDAPALLNWASRRVGMTNAKDLAETTLSMLRGEHGRQAKELDRLVAWLASEARPDVVCLSNALLVGVVRRIKAELGVPVVCWLQDEDIFLDHLPQPERAEAWQTVAERGAEVDAFVAVSRYFADQMASRLALPPERLRVIYNGICLEGYEPAAAPPNPPVIGFLERACPDMGLDTLAEGFIELRASGRFPGLRLRAAGGSLPADEPFLRAVRQHLADAGLGGDAEFLPNLDREAKQAFFRTLSVLSVPTRHGEAFGMYVLESLASGVPVVLPRHGAFPELIEATGGGLLYDPQEQGALTTALERVLSDPEFARQLGSRGRQAVIEHFDVRQTAQQVLALFGSLPKVPHSREPSGG